jgi:cytidylate kinase
MAIVTISRELGSLGTEIADTLSTKLGYSKLDKESLENLLWDLGMSRLQFEGKDEKRPGFWERFNSDKIRYLDFMKTAMYRFAADRDCVIVGRGANIVFGAVPGVLKLRIVAPLPVRVARLRKRYGIDETRALCMIRENDRDRAGYHKYFFDAVWDASAAYSLVVNTSEISPAEVCESVSAVLRSPAHAALAELSRDVVRDLHVAQEVIISIKYRERAPVVSMEVLCRKGVVTLNGTVRSSGAINECVRVAGTVEGVVNVVSNLEIVEYPLSADWRP